MSTVETRVGAFVWHDCVSTDVEAAKSFYTALLGWEIEIFKPGEMDYAMISAGSQSHGGFGPAQGGAPSHWFGHVQIDDCDAAVERAKAGGGTVIAGPLDIPDVGRMCVIADPEGAVFSVYQAATTGPSSEGTFIWDELMAIDVEAAKRFYGAVVGWTAADMDMGEMGTYTLLNRAGDVNAAGLMPKPADMPGPAVWLTYVATDDVDATVARAIDLGASVIVEGMDIPSVGRIAVLSDPTGGAFGLFRRSSS